MVKLVDKCSVTAYVTLSQHHVVKTKVEMPTVYLPPWLSGLAISGRGAVKAWLAIQQGVGSSPTPAGMSSQVSA